MALHCFSVTLKTGAKAVPMIAYTLLSLCFIISPCSITAAQFFTRPTIRDQQTDTIPIIEAQHPINRAMKGGESHNYQIELAADQFLNLIVDQQGIDIVVVVTKPDGSVLMEVDSPNGNNGPEIIQMIADVSGCYK